MKGTLVIVLAILLVIVIPAVLRTQGMTPSEVVSFLFSGKKPEAGSMPRQRTNRNSTGSDIMPFVSRMLRFAKKNNLVMVYPGAVRWKGKRGNLVSLLVMPTEVIGLNCFGYSGQISGYDEHAWKQTVGKDTKQIPSPVEKNRIQYEILRDAMDENGLKEVPLKVLAVFTNPDVRIKTASREVCAEKDLFPMLTERAKSDGTRLHQKDVADSLKQLLQGKPVQAKPCET